MASTEDLREELFAWIDERGAQMPLDAAVADFPDEAINRLPPTRRPSASSLLGGVAEP